jgi:hypothetical protein
MPGHLGEVTDPNARPVVGPVREDDVIMELKGWYVRLCEREAAEARKTFTFHGKPRWDGEIPLNDQYAASQAKWKMDAWERRATAAKNRGVLLMDVDFQRDPGCVMNPQIRALMQRAQVLGLVEYEEQLRTQSP